MEHQNIDFSGNARFEIRRRLGSGTFGVVYEAYDKERAMLVALKNLRRVSPQAIYNFKQEFRALSTLAHLNIASLYEFFAIDEQWFFTMELINGVDFMAYVRQGNAPEFDTIDSISSNSPTLAEGEFMTITSPALPPLSEQKLREASRQLAEGLFALHQAGKLHRDLKPSNVLCETLENRAEARVVILDFGLVMEREEAAATTSRFVVGTAAFMSPEQAAGQPLTPASDWYSFGVMLFQALTGVLPFTGDVRQVLTQKQERSAPLLRQFVADLPEDLEILTMELLRREPEARPTGEEVLRRLGGRASGGSLLSASPFVGREQQLALLHQSFEASANKTVMATVSGASGMGKSTLLKTFLREAKQKGALVLQGKCYERESVPYKALDDLIDSLSRHLQQQRESDLPSLIPPNIKALSMLFPGLLRVKAVATAAEVSAAEDPKEQRRNAFSVLLQLLANLASKQPLILWVDDLQWGDLDSVSLIDEVLSNHLPFLFLGSYRSEEASESQFLQTFLSLKRGYPVREVAVNPLTLQEALDLTLQLLGDDDIVTQVSPSSIAREAQGSPYLVDELVRFLREDPTRISRYMRGDRSIRIEDVLLARAEALPPDERKILDVLAVAGLPLTAKILLHASGLSSAQRSLFSSLQAAKLIEVRGDDRVECFHDRLRESLFAALSDEAKKQLHEQIARALLLEDSCDPESLVFHLKGSGATKQAAEYAQKAAQEATRGLAFDRAASLYQQAIELGSFSPTEQLALKRALAQSLSHAGHSVRAAKLYIEIAQSAPAEEKTILEEKAAEELIRGGEIEDGFVILRGILGSLDLPMATSPTRALLRLIWSRLKIEVKGRKFNPTPAEKISPTLLRKIDLCWSIAMGLGNIDTIHGADYQAKQMLFALEAGETYRVARALCAEAAFVAADGVKKRAISEKALEEAKALCDSLNDNYLRALFTMVSGEKHFLFGEFKEASSLLQRAQELFRAHCVGVSWEIATCQFYQMYSLFYLGEIEALSKLQKKLSREAIERGDLYAATAMSSGHCAMGQLAQDKPQEARKMVEEASKRWSPKGFHVQHFTELLMNAEADLYDGDGAAAHQKVSAAWPQIKKSLILQVQLIRVEAIHLQARSILGAAANHPEKRSMLKQAEKIAKSLQQEKVAWAESFAGLLLAGVLAMREQKSEAAALLEKTIPQLSSQGFTLYAAAARYRQGQLIGGRAGEALQKEASQVFQEQRIVKPEAWVQMLAPGF